MGCGKYGEPLGRKESMRKERTQHLLGCPMISSDSLPNSELLWVKDPEPPSDRQMGRVPASLGQPTRAQNGSTRKESEHTSRAAAAPQTPTDHPRWPLPRSGLRLSDVDSSAIIHPGAGRGWLEPQQLTQNPGPPTVGRRAKNWIQGDSHSSTSIPSSGS